MTTRNGRANSGSFNQFKWIFVYHDRIEARTIKTDNAVQVVAVSADNVFEIPNGLNVWNPSNGDVIMLPYRDPNGALVADTDWNARSATEIVNFETESLGRRCLYSMDSKK